MKRFAYFFCSREHSQPFFLFEIDMGSNLFYMNDGGMDWFSRVYLQCDGGNLSNVSLMSETVMF